VETICEVYDIDSPYTITDEAAIKITSGTFASLAYSLSHTRFFTDLALELLQHPFPSLPPPPNTPPLRKPQPEVQAALFALHLLAEGFKLRMDAMQKWLPKLAELVIVLGRLIRPEWADYWRRMKVECMIDGRIRRGLVSISFPLFPILPSFLV